LDSISNAIILSGYRIFLNPILLVKVIASNVPECAWDSTQKELMCYKFGIYIKTLLNAQRYPYIFTSKKDWTRFFQGTACENFKEQYSEYGVYSVPLIYANYGSKGGLVQTQTFDDFASFGGWTNSIIKKVGHNVKILLNCGPKPRNITVETFVFDG
jgi:hypothetical protein